MVDIPDDVVDVFIINNDSAEFRFDQGCFNFFDVFSLFNSEYFISRHLTFSDFCFTQGKCIFKKRFVDFCGFFFFASFALMEKLF